MIFDPMYFVFLLPALLLGGWAQMRVKSAYRRTSQIPAASGLTGRETAFRILQANNLEDSVDIEMVQGQMSDHYDPKKKVLRLSPDVYGGRSIASLGIAAHEVGHALQDAKGYAALKARNAIVPAAAFGSNASFFIIMAGAFMHSAELVLLGVAAFSLVVIFQLVNLPVEFDASARAKSILASSGMVSPGEQKEVAAVLNAAAWTYVAATVSAILTLVYYLWRLGLLGGRSD